MASFKNQHFVPKCYLRSFSNKADGKSINLYNIRSKRSISTAPIKNQCSRDYFYGKDLKLEKLLGAEESLFSSILQNISGQRFVIDQEVKANLKRFCYLQNRRTEAAAFRFTQAMMEMGTLAGFGSDMPPVAEIRESAILLGLKNFAETLPYIDDLKIVVVRNFTRYLFITLDDPVVMTNRWYIRHTRSKKSQGGIQNSGVIFLFPITPLLLAIIYDSDVYSIPNADGWVNLYSEDDANALNEMQCLNCYANVYFSDLEMRSYVQSSFMEIESLRPPHRHEIFTAILDSEDSWGERYRVVTRKEFESHKRGFIHSRVVSQVPRSWPSCVKWRWSPRVYSNGSAMGYVRKAFIENDPSFKRVKAR